MKYCNQCGNPVLIRVPDGDNRPRFVCGSCHTVHYENPRIVAGCVPIWGDQVLLCRRAIEPRRGYWTLPAGFMENGETLQQAGRGDDAVVGVDHPAAKARGIRHRGAQAPPAQRRRGGEPEPCRLRGGSHRRRLVRLAFRYGQGRPVACSQ